MAKEKGKRPREPRKKPGRPTLYKKTYAAQAYRLALLGATEKEMAEIFNISEQTLNLWKKTHPELIEEISRGKTAADSDVAVSTYKRALGYSHKAVKIFADPKTGRITKVPYTERYPPDTPAAKFWLTNRQRDKWKDRVDVKHDVSEGLANRLAAARKRVKTDPGRGEGK